MESDGLVQWFPNWVPEQTKRVLQNTPSFFGSPGALPSCVMQKQYKALQDPRWQCLGKDEAALNNVSLQ